MLRLPNVGHNLGTLQKRIALQTELFIEEQMPCLDCGGPLKRQWSNLPERDLRCLKCDSSYQVKSCPTGRRVLPGADFYVAKLATVTGGQSHLVIVRHDGQGSVIEVTAVPGHHVTPECIRPRARRFGPQTHRPGTFLSYIDTRPIRPEAFVIIASGGCWVRRSYVMDAWEHSSRMGGTRGDPLVGELWEVMVAMVGRGGTLLPEHQEAAAELFRARYLWDEHLLERLDRALRRMVAERLLERVPNGYRVPRTARQVRDGLLGDWEVQCA